MAKDLTDTLGHAVGRLARETAQSVTSNARKASKSPISGPKGLAAGAGLVALAPLAAKGAGRLVKHQLAGGENPVKKAKDAVSASPVKKAKEAVGGNLKEAVGSKIDEAGGAAGMAKEAGKGLLPGGGGDGDGDKQAGAQIGSTRRMPIQQAIDVAVPIETAYNQWTQFEEWPNFMHRLDRVSQEDETTVKFKAKIWGISREFTAEILEQRPDERIKWRVTEGVNHTGVVTFHELSDRLTRVDVDIDIQPGSLLEKAGRGMRHAKRAIRADLSRFKAYIELEEDETGAWRGKIEDGDVKSTRSSGSSSRGSSGGSSGSSSRGRTRSAAASSGGSSSRGRTRSAAASSGGSSRTARSSGSSGSSKSSGRSSSGRSSGSSKASGRSSGASSGRSSGSSKASGQSSSGRSSGSSKASGRSSSGRSSGSSKASGRSSSGRSSGSSSGTSNGSTRSSRAKSSSNGASASRSTKRKTASSRS